MYCFKQSKGSAPKHLSGFIDPEHPECHKNIVTSFFKAKRETLIISNNRSLNHD